MSDAILSARELHKSYDLGRRKVEVLHGVSLEIGSGDFLSVQGVSGAGKSTLLHLLGGLDEPSDTRARERQARNQSSAPAPPRRCFARKTPT